MMTETIEALKKTEKASATAIDLISRQQAKIEELKAENERLERQVRADDKYAEALKTGITVISEKLKTAKAEARKEFAEELKKKMVKHNFKYADTLFSANVATVPMVDNLLKEMESANND